MHNRMCCFARLFFMAMFSIALLLPQSIAAESQLEGWSDIELQPVTHKEAEAYYKARQAQLDAASTSQSQTAEQSQTATSTISLAAATTTSTRITQLARALKNDPKLIYDYVHNHIHFTPYFGSLKGAELTLLEQSGNAFDQASLLIALLRASGNNTAQYVYATVTVPGNLLTNWLGVDPPAVFSALVNGGIPVTALYVDGAATFNHVWVQLTNKKKEEANCLIMSIG